MTILSFGERGITDVVAEGVPLPTPATEVETIRPILRPSKPLTLSHHRAGRRASKHRVVLQGGDMGIRFVAFQVDHPVYYSHH
jgi:hypothetical protein